MLASHYAPRAAVRIGAARVLPGEALLAFGPKRADKRRRQPERASIAAGVLFRGFFSLAVLAAARGRPRDYGQKHDTDYDDGNE